MSNRTRPVARDLMHRSRPIVDLTRLPLKVAERENFYYSMSSPVPLDFIVFRTPPQPTQEQVAVATCLARLGYRGEKLEDRIRRLNVIEDLLNAAVPAEETAVRYLGVSLGCRSEGAVHYLRRSEEP